MLRLTVKERILLHLFEFTKFAESIDVTQAITQTGIATATRIEVQHVMQYTRPLLKEGLVRERLAHIKGSSRRRKVYDLTDSGKMAAVRLREVVKSEVVRVRDSSGTREAPIAEVLKQAGPGTSLVEIVRQAMDPGVVDLAALPAAAGEPVPLVARLADAPRISRFVGRHAELGRLTTAAGETRVFVIRGVAGIGKSYLAAKACDDLRGTRSLFWHRVRPWDTRQSILAAIAEFLAAAGRPGLRSVLRGGETGRIDDVLRRELPGSRGFIVFDDAQEASSEVLALFAFLREILADAPDLRMLVLTRRKLPFYDRRDVLIGGVVDEIDLGGLDADDIATFMGRSAEAPILVDVGRRLGGHPLSLELIRSTGSSARDRGMGDVQRFIEEEIYRELSDSERTVMKAASLYSIAVPREVLLSLPSTSHDILLSLENRALLRRVGDESYEVHDTIRDFFARILTPAERESLGATATEQLRHLAVRAHQEGDLVLCIDCLSNALAVLPPGADDPDLWEFLGDSQGRIGDLPAALTAWRQAIRPPEDAERLARVHRKMAASLEDRGDITSASTEVETGRKALGETLSAERGWLDVIRCRIAYRLADWEQARDAGESALETFEAFDVRPGQARALLILGHIAMHSPQNDPDLAGRYLTQALERSASVEDVEFGADVRIALAHLLAWHLRDVRGAMSQIAAIEVLEAAMDLPQVRRKLRLFQGMFRLIFFADYETAGANFREALDEARKIHDFATVANAKVGLGYAEYFQGRFAEARRLYTEAADELRAQGLLVDAVNILLGISEAAFLEGDQPAAYDILVTLMSDPSLSRAVNARTFWVSLTEGYTSLLQGEREEAYAALTDAVRRAAGESSVSEGTMTYDFVGCISWPAVYALLYCGAALRFLGRAEEGDAQIAKARDIAKANEAKAWLEGMPKVERGITEALQRLLGARKTGDGPGVGTSG